MEIYIFWTILSLMLLIMELFIPGTFFFLFLSLAGISTSAACFLLNLSWMLSGVFFSILSIVFLAVFHNQYRSYWSAAESEGEDMNNSLSQLIERSGQVISIKDEVLKIKIGSYYWSAKKQNTDSQIVLNSIVRVVGYDKMTLIVVPIEPPSETS